MLEIHIYDENKSKWEQIDIIESTFNLSILYEDYKSLGSKFNSYSKNIDIVPSKKSDNIFRSAFDLNLNDPTWSLNSYNKCKVFIDNILFKQGRIRIQSIEKTSTNHLYKCKFFGDSFSIFSDTENNQLSDMDNSSLNHIWNTSNVKNSWNDFLSGSIDYTYPWIDYGNSIRRSLDDKYFWEEDGLQTRDLYPSVRVKYYLDKIFETYGYTYTSTLLNEDWFKQLVIPFNKEYDTENVVLDDWEKVFNGTNLDYSTVMSDSDLAYRYNSIKEAFHPVKKYDLEGVDGGTVSAWPGDGTYPTNIYPNHNYNYQTFLAGYVDSTYYEDIHDKSGVIKGVKVNLDLLDQSFPQRGYSGIENLDVEKDWYYKINNTGIYKLNFKIRARYSETISEGFTDLFGVFFGHCKKGTWSLNQNSLTVTSIPEEYGRVSSTFWDETSYKEFEVNVEDIKLEQGDIIFPKVHLPQDRRMRVQLTSIDIYTKSILPNSTANVDASNFTTDMKQKDLLTSITKMFNLVWEQDKNDPLNYIIEDKNNWLDNTVIDFNPIADVDSIIIETPSELSGKEIRLRHRKSTNIPSAISYESNNDVEYRQFSEKHIDNEFSKEDNKKIIETEFTETPLQNLILEGHGQRGNIVLTRFNKYKEFNTKIGTDHILFFSQSPFNKNVSVKFRFDDGIYNTFPYAGVLSYPSDYTGVEDFDLLDFNFDTQPTLPFKWSDYYEKGYTNKNLYNLFWSDTIKTYINANQRVITLNVIINNKLINEIMLSNKIAFDGGYWRINEIIDWNPSNTKTKVKLIKDLTFIDDSQPIYDMSKSQPFETDSTDYGVDNSTKNSLVVGDNNVTNNGLVTGDGNAVSSGSVIEGDDNLVTSPADGGSVILGGDNNTITHNGVIVIGTDNFTSTEDGEVVINDIVYSPDGKTTHLYGLNDPGKNGYSTFTNTDVFLNDPSPTIPVPGKGILNDPGKI